MLSNALHKNANRSAWFRNIAVATFSISLLAGTAHAKDPPEGGPYEPIVAGSQPAADKAADAQFRSLFVSWKKLDAQPQAAIAVPSLQPVENVALSSSFGVRSDPFRRTAAMHAGVDIPGRVGTPVYATADGVVGRAERAGGYGNLVELEHGKGIQTRYGHLSKLLVEANTKVTRGQLIGLMGSTGRSTGSHLHYEVRIDGQPVNPMPFLLGSDALLARPHDGTPADTQTASVAAGGR
jgi:murein DD-endopeptidase MepM/ murein hydrolase activator NlpD